MPTRILYWNIEKFGLNKIVGNAKAAQRLAIIGNHILAANPQIFVIVEQGAGTRPANNMTNGHTIVGNGLNGCIQLLAALRATAVPGYANWALVPPLISGVAGFAEAIAVFYRADLIEFVGPWVWPLGGAGPAVAPGPATGNYNAPFNNFLPVGNVNGASPINAGMPYLQLAGQWDFMDAMGLATIQFPGPNNRKPFYTTFRDPGNGGILHLHSFHAASNFFQARNGTANFGNIPEMTMALGANDKIAVVGDFNVSLFNAALSTPAYAPFLAAGFNRMLNPLAPAGLPQNWYLYTHNKPHKQVDPFTTPPTLAPNGYPGFGYMGSDINHPGYESIDNIMWRYGGGGGAAANATIMNPVVGSPYNATPAPGGAPIGTIAFASQLANAIPLPGGQPYLNWAGGFNIGARRQFQGWNNYRIVRSTSDHMALCIDI